MQKRVEKLKQLHLACVMAPTNTTHADALFSHLQTFSPLTTEGAETFALLAQSDFVPELVAIFSSSTTFSPSLISECFKLLVDFTDPSTFEIEQDRKVLLQLVNRILDCDLPQVAIAHEAFAQGLEFYENLCEIYPSASPDHLAERTTLLDRLTELLLQQGGEDAEQALTASELLSIVINASAAARSSFKADKLLPVFTKLQTNTNSNVVLRVEEEEMFENVCAVFARIVLNSPQRKLKFGDQVLQQAFACIKANSQFAKRLGFKLIASVCKNSPENCSKFVDMGGLKIVFVFQPSKQQLEAKRMRQELLGDQDTTSSALSLLASLCLNLRDVYFQRILAKLREQGKMDILLALHCDYASRVASKVDELEKEEAEDYDSEDEYMELAECGLQELEHVDIILASLWSTSTTTSTVSKEIADEVRKIVADCAERELVLDDDTEVVLEANTVELKAKLVNLALFQ